MRFFDWLFRRKKPEEKAEAEFFLIHEPEPMPPKEKFTVKARVVSVKRAEPPKAEPSILEILMPSEPEPRVERPKLSYSEIQRRAKRRAGSTITDFGKHMKGKGSKHQLPHYRQSVKARKPVEEEE